MIMKQFFEAIVTSRIYELICKFHRVWENDLIDPSLGIIYLVAPKEIWDLNNFQVKMDGFKWKQLMGNKLQRVWYWSILGRLIRWNWHFFGLFFPISKTVKVKVVFGMWIFNMHGFQLLCYDVIHHLLCLALRKGKYQD